MTDYADGIYFEMPEEEYHAVDRFSKSAIKKVRVSPADYWADSSMNPHREELTPEQEKRRALTRLLGKAYHCARLEPDHFALRFIREISQADFAGVDGFLSSGSAIEAELAALGLPKKSKDDNNGVFSQAVRLAEAGYQGPIWHIEQANWLATVDGRTPIPATAWEQILIDMERIAKVPAVHALLTGGEAEVTIFYTCPESGIPMKSRIDYLRPDAWAEFKTFENSNGKPLLQCINDAIRFNRYHIDAVAYLHALELVRQGVVNIVGEATAAQRELIEAVQLRDAALDCHFIYQQKSGVPNILERKFRFWEVPVNTEAQTAGAADPAGMRESTRMRTLVHDLAIREIRAAKRDYLAHMEIYGRDQEWLPFNPSGETTDLDFPTFWLEQEV